MLFTAQISNSTSHDCPISKFVIIEYGYPYIIPIYSPWLYSHIAIHLPKNVPLTFRISLNIYIYTYIYNFKCIYISHEISHCCPHTYVMITKWSLHNIKYSTSSHFYSYVIIPIYSHTMWNMRRPIYLAIPYHHQKSHIMPFL